MQRYFSEKKEGKELFLSNDDIYHITKVMRMNVGDNIEVVYQKETFICQIKSLQPFKVFLVSNIDEDNENEKKIIIVQSLVNENKMDLILQKCTELGMNEFYAFKAHNSVVKENEKTDKKIIRWQKIVKEAAEQSKRNIIPTVCSIVDLKKLCNIKADLKILLSVNEKTKNVKKVLQESKIYDTIIIVVGPEGGFTKDEEDVLIKSGFISTSLGKRVLRTETASITCLSMINYEWMV